MFWGAVRTALRPEDRQLGFAREEALVWWLGKRGMRWAGVLPEFHRFIRLDRPPDVLVLHVGGNNLGVRPFQELIRDIKFDMLCLWATLLKVITVWSDIVTRKVWKEA